MLTFKMLIRKERVNSLARSFLIYFNGSNISLNLIRKMIII